MNEAFLIKAKEECNKIKEIYAVGLQELASVFSDKPKPKYHVSEVCHIGLTNCE